MEDKVTEDKNLIGLDSLEDDSSSPMVSTMIGASRAKLLEAEALSLQDWLHSIAYAPEYRMPGVALSNHVTAAKPPTGLALRSEEFKPLFTWPR